MKRFIKICGVTSLMDAKLVLNLGANAIGLNLYSKSPRKISLETASKIYSMIDNKIQVFLVFVNEEDTKIKYCLERFPKAIPQFHGNETGEFCRSFKTSYVKAIGVDKDTNFRYIEKEFSDAKMLLLDNYDVKKYGGTGKSFDWKLVDNDLKIPYLLAGGINISNVLEALNQTKCLGVDVSSSLESQVGKKDHEKVRNIIKTVRKSYE
tara:strand:- start:10719 stop:11342 length:624 start_codon:yes stop_codon:yes gene_type:complete